MTYAEKLKHPKWQKRRLEILEAHGFKCSTCQSGDKTLHVHHRRYRKGAEPWEYGDDDLDCLCEDCHKETTALDRQISDHLSAMDDGLRYAVLGYVVGLRMFCHDIESVHLEALSAETFWGIDDAFGFNLGPQSVDRIPFKDRTFRFDDLERLRKELQCERQKKQ